MDIYNLTEVEPIQESVNLSSAVLYVDGNVVDAQTSSLKSGNAVNEDSLIFVYSGRFPGKQFCFTSTAAFEKWAKCYKSTEKLIESNIKLNSLVRKAVESDAISYYDKTGEITP